MVRALSTASICRPQEQLAGLVALQQYGEIGSRGNRRRLRKHDRRTAAAGGPVTVSPITGGTPAGTWEGGLPAASAAAGGELPQHVLQTARELAKTGNVRAVQKWMAQNGYPAHEAWCGDFAAAVVKSSGGEPPKNPAWADNWADWGVHSDKPVPGGVAVRRFHIGGHGHVTTTTGEV